MISCFTSSASTTDHFSAISRDTLSAISMTGSQSICSVTSLLECRYWQGACFRGPNPRSHHTGTAGTQKPEYERTHASSGSSHHSSCMCPRLPPGKDRERRERRSTEATCHKATPLSQHLGCCTPSSA